VPRLTGRWWPTCEKSKQHNNPDAIEAERARGAQVLFLPRQGKHLNPIELLFNDLKQHHLRPADDELEKLIDGYMGHYAPR